MILAVAIVMSVQVDYNPKQWGIEALELIRKELYIPKSKLYAERTGNDKKPSFNWPAGVMLSALAAAARADDKYKPWLKEYADATRVYWNLAKPTPGFDVLPMPKSKDRYYDDNAWMCLALLETFEILGDKKYLGWAKDTFNFVMSGWNEKLGGGIYWRENEKTSKNTCSNAPSALCAMRIAAINQDLGLRVSADKIWQWTNKNLQDPLDKLYWDNISTTKKIETTKWSYNTALMMRAALFRAGMTTHLEANSWFQLGNASLEPALKKWCDPETGAIKDGAAFAHLLFEALVQYQKVSSNAELLETLKRALQFLRNKNRDAKGHYGSSWSETPKPTYKVVRLIDQASAARAFFVAASDLKQ